jgi:hypothetical protein
MSEKYPRTFHLPWSPGATNDDKIAKDVSSLVGIPITITEKVDGSNACMEKNNCFSRSHSGPPTHASFDGLKALHASLKYLIPEGVQLFGEWCYALHSISYDRLPSYFLLFNVYYTATKEWASWDEVSMYADELEFHTVPVLYRGIINNIQELRDITEQLAQEPSQLGTLREGIVIRASDTFNGSDFSKYVMKWVRANHVQTSEHWKNQEIVKNGLLKQ